MQPEFSRVLHAERLPREGRTERLEPTEAEREALARRFGIPSVERLSAEIRLKPEPGGSVHATGRLQAEVVQNCVVTLDPLTQRVDEPVDLWFLPEGSEPSDNPDSPDEITMEGGTFDLGEAVAEQLALALDPYPRKEGAELPSAATEDAAHPFAALSALKRRG